MIAEGIAGVVTGLVGTIATSWLNLRSQKEKNKHELNMVEAETKAMIAEANANIRITEAQVAGEVEKLDAQAYTESLKAGNQQALSNKTLEKLFASPWTMPFGVILATLMGFVDFLRHLMRPALTGYLVVVSSWLTWEATKIIQAKQEVLTATMATEIFSDMVNVIFYLTVSVVTWWFGDRRVAKFLYRLNDGNTRDN